MQLQRFGAQQLQQHGAVRVSARTQLFKFLLQLYAIGDVGDRAEHEISAGTRAACTAEGE